MIEQRNTTMLPGEKTADFCRRMGYVPGTRLAGDEGFGITIIEITAIGEELILAKKISRNGRMINDGEGLWNLGYRDWARI